MESYKHILLAADFSEHGETVANRAKRFGREISGKTEHCACDGQFADYRCGLWIDYSF